MTASSDVARSHDARRSGGVAYRGASPAGRGAVVGYLSAHLPGPSARLTATFRQGLKDSGYIEGENVTIIRMPRQASSIGSTIDASPS